MLDEVLDTEYEWNGPSADPYDEQFGDIVETTTPDSAAENRIVLVGEPYDGAVLGRPGARSGPAAVRDALAGTKTAHLDGTTVESIGDLGDVNIPVRKSVSGVQSFLYDVTEAIHDLDSFPVFIGGDHSVSYPNVAPLLARKEKLGVINIDAHADVRTVTDEPYNGTPFGQLYEDGLEEYALVGARHFETSIGYLEDLEKKGANIVSTNDVSRDPVEAIEGVLDELEAEALYVSCDIDVLDMTAAPGSTAPTPGGLRTRELYEMLWSVAQDDRVVGFDFVGTAQHLDSTPKSAKAASRAVAYFVHGHLQSVE